MSRKSAWWPLAVLAGSALLTFFTVYDQVYHRTGVEFILGDQLERHQAVLAGRSIDPWQYRVLPELVVEAAIRSGRWLRIEDPVLTGFVFVRTAQNLAIFILAAVYWGKLGLGRLHSLLGLTILAWGISYAGYASGLALSSYFDLIFYLLAAWLIVDGRLWGVIPVVALATLNRETAGLIPLALAVASIRSNRAANSQALAISAAAMAVFAVEYAGLRLLIGDRPFMRPHGQTLGLGLLELNLTWIYSYFSTVASFSLLPWLALAFWRRWPWILRRLFWGIVPIWLVVHLFLGAVAEARLLLVPYVIVLLPAALLVVQDERLEDRAAA